MTTKFQSRLLDWDGESDIELAIRGELSDQLIDVHKTHTLKQSLLKKWFEAELEKITKLIKAQLDAARKKGHAVELIMLVGGLSLHKHVKNHLIRKYPEFRIELSCLEKRNWRWSKAHCMLVTEGRGSLV